MITIQNIIIDVRNAVARHFPQAEPLHIDRMISLCLKNEGLALVPIEKPDFIFAYFSYWPWLIDAVENWNWPELNKHVLRYAPILHIAALILPASGYGCTRELISAINPMAVSCHRIGRNGLMRFHFKKNWRFSEERAQNATLH